MAERPRREKVLTAADLKRKADREALKAAREGKKSRLDSLVVRVGRCRGRPPACQAQARWTDWLVD